MRWAEPAIIKRTPDAATKLVSQALPETLTLSKVCSFFVGWPKTWLRTQISGQPVGGYANALADI